MCFAIYPFPSTHNLLNFEHNSINVPDVSQYPSTITYPKKTSNPKFTIMSPLPMPVSTRNKPPHHRQRRGSASHSSTSSLSGDEDAITPCPLDSVSSQQPQHQKYQQNQQQQQQSEMMQEQATQRTQSRRPSTSSWRNSQVLSSLDPLDANGDANDGGACSPNIDPETLWLRMLTIQRMFGCYNSARMRAALDTGAESGFVRTFFRTNFFFLFFLFCPAANLPFTYISLEDLPRPAQ
jgi:hypothetical protein